MNYVLKPKDEMKSHERRPQVAFAVGDGVTCHIAFLQEGDTYEIYPLENPHKRRPGRGVVLVAFTGDFEEGQGPEPTRYDYGPDQTPFLWFSRFAEITRGVARKEGWDCEGKEFDGMLEEYLPESLTIQQATKGEGT